MGHPAANAQWRPDADRCGRPTAVTRRTPTLPRCLPDRRADPWKIRIKIGWQDADDKVSCRIQGNGFTDGAGIGIKPPLPEVVAENDHMTCAGDVFFLVKITAELGVDTKRAEKIV